MTTKEMIEVMQHYVNGGEVEFRVRKGGAALMKEWLTALNPPWDWATYDYRIKPGPKKTKTVWFWRIKTTNEWFLTTCMYTEEEVRYRWPDALEFKRMDMLGSEEVEDD